MRYNENDRNFARKGEIPMTQISVSELKTNAGKYVTMAKDQDILITKNGKVVAKIVSAKPDKKAAWNHLTELFKGISFTDAEVEALREERINGR